jgi:hypothetical protein
VALLEHEALVVLGDGAGLVDHLLHGAAQTAEPGIVDDAFEHEETLLEELLALLAGHRLRGVLDDVGFQHGRLPGLLLALRSPSNHCRSTPDRQSMAAILG